MNTCEYLARLGFATLRGEPTTPERVDEDDTEGMAAAAEVARLADHKRVRKLLIDAEAEPRTGGLQGVRWVRLITWPDRVPGLVTWAGQATLAKTVKKLVAAVRAANDQSDLYEIRVPLDGASGFDADTAQDTIDVGFSTSALGMEVVQRPGLELLAVVGLETVPLVSFGPRECGFVHDGRLWRFPVESRNGGYYHRWGPLSAVTTLD